MFRGENAVSVYGTVQTRRGRYEGRYDITYGSSKTGTVRDLRDAVALALHLPPRRRFLKVSSRELLSSPLEYGFKEGHWVGRPEVDSR